jgi:hypothetical protein
MVSVYPLGRAFTLRFALAWFDLSYGFIMVLLCFIMLL